MFELLSEQFYTMEDQFELIKSQNELYGKVIEKFEKFKRKSLINLIRPNINQKHKLDWGYGDRHSLISRIRSCEDSSI